MTHRFGTALVLLAALLAPAPALAACQIVKDVELPVTVANGRALVTVQINGHDARFVLDSGAYASTISKTAVVDLKLPVHDSRIEMTGPVGVAPIQMAKVEKFNLGGHVISNITLQVDDDTRHDGILGQNFLGFEDVEYDLPHGIVRLLTGEGCNNANMAYWAGARPFAVVTLERTSQTIGTVAIDGVEIRARFDSATTGVLVTRAAAKRFGVTQDKTAQAATPIIKGLYETRVPSWPARVDKIDIGGEMIGKPWIRVADLDIDHAEAVIGIDFFLTHRIYVDNRNHRMFVTYEGGPLFGLDPKRAVDEHGAAIDLSAAVPNDVAGYMRRGAAFFAAGKFDAAIAEFDKAVAMAPKDAQPLTQRARAYLGNKQPAPATTDLDKAIALTPGDADTRLLRATLRLEVHDTAGTLVDLKAADGVLTPSADARLQLAQLYDLVDADDAAIAGFTLWLDSHPDNGGRALALSGRCLARARLNRDLDRALADCEGALRLWPDSADYLDGRAIVRFHRGEFGKALADFDAGVKAQPQRAWRLYARSLAERRTGDTTHADKDRAAALAIDPKAAEPAKRLGMEQ